MQRIALTRGQYALVDDEDYSWLNSFKWYAQKTRVSYYAARKVRVGDGQIIIYMHRLILGVDSQVDHKDRDSLNNTRDNLRRATTSQNACNREKRPGSSKYRGVYRVKKTGRWAAAIRLEGTMKHLGSFGDEAEAAKAYDLEAQHRGVYARLNFPIT